MTGGQLGRICRAIEELAARSSGPADPDGGVDPAPRRGGGDYAARDGTADQERHDDENSVPDPEIPADAGAAEEDLVARLAAIWEMVAAADPELAKRLPGYLSAAE